MLELLGLYNYWIVIVLMMIGFYTVIQRPNLIKKIIGLFIFQTSVFILFISMANVEGANAPIITSETTAYSNPLPHVMILTAIVVSVATTALGLAIVVRIKEAYGTINEDEIHVQDVQDQPGFLTRRHWMNLFCRGSSIKDEPAANSLSSD